MGIAFDEVQVLGDNIQPVCIDHHRQLLVSHQLKHLCHRAVTRSFGPKKYAWAADCFHHQPRECRSIILSLTTRLSETALL